MNKIHILIIPFLLLCFSTMAKAVERPEENQYRISGKVKGLKGWVYMWLDTDKVDSTNVRNEQFVFCGSVEQLGFATIYNNEGMFVPVIPDGCSITISGDMTQPSQIQLSGSPLTKKVLGVRDTLESGIERIRNEAKSTEDRIKMVDKWIKDELIPTITKNADNLAGVIAISDNRFYLSLDEKMQCLSLLSDQMQQNAMIKRQLAITKQQMLVTEGKPYLDIRLPDSAGQVVHLSDVVGEGKYVLVDFWASWCGPCIRAIPDLKKVYDKYHTQGFEVFGVSLDKERGRWVKAIEKNGLNWWHVSDLKLWDCQGAAIYGVESVPNTFLIDTDGIIIKKNPSSEELELILNEGLSK